MIQYSAICFTHKIIQRGKPENITVLYKKTKTNRAKTKWYTLYQPKTMAMKNFHIYKALEYFYLLPLMIQKVMKSNLK